MKKTIFIIAVSLLTACSEDRQADKVKATSPEQNNGQTLAQPNTAQSMEKTADILTGMLTQQKQTLDQSLTELNQAIEQISEDYENNFSLTEANLTGLAEKLGKLARQAGEGAKTLEKTGKILGQAIQKGFEEGYHQKTPETQQKQGQ